MPQGGRNVRGQRFGEEFLRQGELHALHAVRNAGQVIGRCGHAGGIVGVLPRNGLQHQRVVPHGFGEGADLVQAGGKGHQTVAGNQPVGGLHAHNAAEGRGLADGAAGVRPKGKRRFVGGHRSRRAAAGAAGHPIQRPGVVGRLEGRVFGGGAHGEFVHVQLPQHHRALLVQRGHHRGIVRGNPVFQHLAGAGGAHALGADVVLNAAGHAVQRAKGLSGGPARVRCIGGRQRFRPGHGQVGRHVAVPGGNGVQIGLCGLTGGYLARRQRLAQLAKAHASDGFISGHLRVSSLFHNLRHKNTAVLLGRGTGQQLIPVRAGAGHILPHHIAQRGNVG